MIKLLAILFFCAILSVSAQDKPKTSIERLQDAIKILEFEAPKGGISYPFPSPLVQKLDEKQREMVEIQNKLIVIQIIQEAIKELQAEKQRTRVMSVPPTP